MSDNDDSDSDTVDGLANAEQPESVLSQETVEKKQRRAKNVMSADTEDVLIEWILETPCLYQEFERLQRYTEQSKNLG